MNHSIDPNKVTNLHEAMQDSMVTEVTEKNKPPEEDPNKVMIKTFRARTGTIRLAEQICRSNGTTLGGFLRSCCEGLVKDYGLPLDQD